MVLNAKTVTLDSINTHRRSKENVEGEQVCRKCENSTRSFEGLSKSLSHMQGNTISAFFATTINLVRRFLLDLFSVTRQCFVERIGRAAQTGHSFVASFVAVQHMENSIKTCNSISARFLSECVGHSYINWKTFSKCTW